jgi:hypothetical protein
VCPVRHRGSGVLGELEAQGVMALQMRKSSECRGDARGEEEDGKAKSRTSARHAILKGVSATPHLRRHVRRVRQTFAHVRAPRRNNRPLARLLGSRRIRTCSVCARS